MKVAMLILVDAIAEPGSQQHTVRGSMPPCVVLGVMTPGMAAEAMRFIETLSIPASREPQTYENSRIPDPCPFCAWPGVLYREIHATEPGYVMCTNLECMAIGPEGKDDGDAIARWNLRVGTARLQWPDGAAAQPHMK